MANFPQSYVEVRRMGTRIEDMASVDTELTWLLVAGRNVDGTIWRASVPMVLRDGGWRRDGAPKPEQLATLPEGWPPTLDTFERQVELQVSAVMSSLEAAKRAAEAAE